MTRAALTPQVSRERVGCELDQMVRSAAPLRAFQLMDDMNLLPIVFPLPEGFVLPMDDDQTRAYEFGMVYLKVFSPLYMGKSERSDDALPTQQIIYSRKL